MFVNVNIGLLGANLTTRNLPLVPAVHVGSTIFIIYYLPNNTCILSTGYVPQARFKLDFAYFPPNYFLDIFYLIIKLLRPSWQNFRLSYSVSHILSFIGLTEIPLDTWILYIPLENRVVIFAMNAIILARGPWCSLSKWLVRKNVELGSWIKEMAIKWSKPCAHARKKKFHDWKIWAKLAYVNLWRDLQT